MNQRNNEPSELEMKLTSNAIDVLIQSMNLSMSAQQLQEFKEQAVKDAKAIANEWEIEQCQSKDTEES
ncbi:MAG: hypothetical protein QNJ53_27975 [Pleurocapsa sp. MO_192.B19]|nr:hypothetical protein [Pleurocapsa sp. MO_192.B19]